MPISKKTVISSMIWKLLERFSTQLVSFIVSVVLARLLMPDDYGIIAIILVFINFANIIVDGGFNTALIQKKDANQSDFSTIFWFSLFVAALLYGLLFFFAPLIARFYNKEVLTSTLRVLSLSIFFNSFNSVQRAYVSRHMLFRKLFYVNSIGLAISGTIGLTLAYLGYGVWSLVLQTLSNSIACCFLMWITIKWRPTIEFSITNFKGLFDYGWKILSTNMIITIYENVRSLVIGKIYQPAVLAYFDRGKMLPSLIMSNITASIDSVLLPTFSEEQEKIVRVKQMTRRSVQISYLFIAPFLVFFFFTANEIVLLLLTEKWLPIVPFVKIFCIAFFLMPIQNINLTCIKSLGYSDLILRMEIGKKIIEAVILIVSFMINVYAVAWGIVLYNFISLFININPCNKLINYSLNEQIKDILPALIASFLMGFAVFLCGMLVLPTLLSFFVKIVIGIIVYYLLCRLLKYEGYSYVTSFFADMINRKK